MLNFLSVAVRPPCGVVLLSAELAGENNSFLKRAHKYDFSNKIRTQSRRLLKKPMRHEGVGLSAVEF